MILVRIGAGEGGARLPAEQGPRGGTVRHQSDGVPDFVGEHGGHGPRERLRGAHHPIEPDVLLVGVLRGETIEGTREGPGILRIPLPDPCSPPEPCEPAFEVIAETDTHNMKLYSPNPVAGALPAFMVSTSSDYASTTVIVPNVPNLGVVTEVSASPQRASLTLGSTSESDEPRIQMSTDATPGNPGVTIKSQSSGIFRSSATFFFLKSQGRQPF